MAAIDVGTNSFHLLVARVVDTGGFEPLAREKEVVRLGSGSGDMKVLHPDAVDRGIAALRRFRQIADISEARIVAVATSAVREAPPCRSTSSRACSSTSVAGAPSW